MGRWRPPRGHMDFKARVQFGRTGRMVSRLGLASGYGVPTAAIEKAFHESGVNYFYLSLLERGHMVQAIRNLAAHRDELFIVLARPTSHLLEYLAGYTIIEAKDLDEAIALASGFVGPSGLESIEVRPLIEMDVPVAPG